MAPRVTLLDGRRSDVRGRNLSQFCSAAHRDAHAAGVRSRISKGRRLPLQPLRACAFCSVEFRPRRRTGRFCSDKCCLAFQRRTEKGRESQRKHNYARRDGRPRPTWGHYRRVEVFAENDGCCWICERVAVSPTIDHVYPLSLGGLDVRANVRTACAGCNARRGALWPEGPVWAAFLFLLAARRAA